MRVCQRMFGVAVGGQQNSSLPPRGDVPINTRSGAGHREEWLECAKVANKRGNASISWQ